MDGPAKWGFEGLGIEATLASRRLLLNRSIAEVKRALLLWAGKEAASERQNLARSSFAFVGSALRFAGLAAAVEKIGARAVLMPWGDWFGVALWQTDTVQVHPRIVSPRFLVVPKLDAFERTTFARQVDDVVFSSG